MNAELYILRDKEKAKSINAELSAISNALKKKNTKIAYKTELDNEEEKILEAIAQSTNPSEQINYVIIPNAVKGNSRSTVYDTLDYIVSGNSNRINVQYYQKAGNQTGLKKKAVDIKGNRQENGCYFIINNVFVILLPENSAAKIGTMTAAAVDEIAKKYPDVENLNVRKDKEEETFDLIGGFTPQKKKETHIDIGDTANIENNPVNMRTYSKATIDNSSPRRNKLNNVKTAEGNTENPKDGSVVLSGTGAKPRKKVGFFKRNFIPIGMDSTGEKVRKIILDLAIIVFIATAVILMKVMVVEPIENNNKYDEIRDLVKQDTIEIATEITTDAEGHKVVIPVKQSKNWDKLKQINSEVVGWISIDDTRIDYPVLQHPGDNDDAQFYLHRDIYCNYSGYGSIFLDYRSNKAIKSKNLILHGHHMRDGSMFENLMGYGKYNADMDFYRQHPTIHFDTPEGDAVYKIISVYKTSTLDAHGDFFNYLTGSFESDAEFMNYVYLVRMRSLINTGVTCNEKDQLLTLSTCSYEYTDFRTVVVARKTRIGEEDTVDVSKATANPSPLWPDVYYGYDDSKKPAVYTFATEKRSDLLSWYDGKGNLQGKERMFTLHDDDIEIGTENTTQDGTSQQGGGQGTVEIVTVPPVNPQPNPSGGSPDGNTKEADSILFNYSTLALTVGQTDTLEIYWTPNDVTDKSIKWESSNSRIATIAKGGIVTAKAEGECTISAETANGKKTTCKVVVSPIVATSVTIEPASYTTSTIGEQFKLKATVEPAKHSHSITWESSDRKVAVVTSNGTVRIKGYGTCTVTGSIDGMKVNCRITVNKPASPTQAPTQKPTQKPTQAPTQKPTPAPTQAPTQAPTAPPTAPPTEPPTQAPEPQPTAEENTGG